MTYPLDENYDGDQAISFNRWPMAGQVVWADR
jgi:hypothetical protein